MTGLPGQLAALARHVTGEIAEVADRSWQREGSAVWEIADAAGGCWFVKRHSSERFHQREVAAYRHWTAALGPGRAPDLAAADSQMLAIVISGLPGQTALNLRLAGDDERELHRQAGELLRRLHNAAPPVPGGPGLRQGVKRVEEHLSRASALLTPPEIALVRRCAAELPALAPELPAVPTHGDAQLRNWLWNQATRQLAMIDFERAETGPAVRDLFGSSTVPGTSAPTSGPLSWTATAGRWLTPRNKRCRASRHWTPSADCNGAPPTATAKSPAALAGHLPGCGSAPREGMLWLLAAHPS